MSRPFYLIAALVGLILIALGPWAWAIETRGYQVTLTVRTDGWLDVTELITVDFDIPRHGIYRSIPYSYRLPTGERYNLRLVVEEVLAGGKPAPVKKTRQDGSLIVRIGDPDVLVTGEVTYTIRYRVARALRKYGDELEIYWNAIGTGWELPIEHAAVTVILPPGVPKEEVRAVGYRGPWGSSNPFELAWSEGKLSGEATKLFPGEGITIAVRFPAGYVHLPGLGTTILWFMADNAYFGIPILTLGTMTLLWWKRGRDPRVGPVPPSFEPPKEVGPAEAGVLIDDRFDPRDLSAAIVGLATKGHLKISEIWEDEWGKLPDDFELERLTSQAPLTRFEDGLLDALFPSGDKTQLSALKFKLYDKIEGLKTRLYMDLTEKGYYVGNPERVRAGYSVVAGLFVVLGVFMGTLSSSLYLGLALGISGGIVALFAPFMPKKTSRGIQVLREILGLEEYIRRAEVRRIEFAAAERHFEELLPYAMAFGLTEVWTRAFEGLLKEPPDWYEGRFPTFAPYYLGWRLTAFQGAAHTVATSRPRSAGGWSGGSGFGGGFSGGGMGGGGGGAW